MKQPIDLVVGFDQREAIAYHVFCQTILERSSLPVRFLPLARQTLVGYEDRFQDGSNMFTYTRFLCPYLMGFKGWAIFADGDMVCLDDIAKLWALRDSTKAIQVVKHDYITKASKKYLGNKNENYPRKNWSSMMLWNCEHPDNRCLTPEFIQIKDGAYLHRFEWLEDEKIGDLPKEWNWLAIEYESKNDVQLIHYTLGTPCFNDYRNSEMSGHWHKAYERTTEGIGK